jgi:hypothetical protein
MVMAEILVCWKCGSSLEGLPLPLGRSAECEACNADLHVCRLCQLYDPRVAKACREPIAEEVHNKERANFCGLFQPRSGAYVARDDSATKKGRAELSALFGEPLAEGAPSDAEAARKAWENLFGSAEKNEK